MPHINKQMISFFLTTKCNLRCVYCYNSNERAKLEEKTLSVDIAKAGIDYFFTNNSSRHIRFYGPGEPTQAFDALCKITEYARSKSTESVTTEIQTNGAFGHKICEWMLDNMNIIWVSFDGEPDIQNSNRPFPNNKESAPTIEANIRWLNENKGNRKLMVGARVTITELNIDRQREMVDYFYSLGIRYVWTDPLFPSVDNIPVIMDDDKKNSFSFDMDKYVINYLDAYHYAKSKDFFYGSFLACNFDGETKKHCRACTPTPHLTPDGYISACDMVTFGENAHHMDCFVYGKWDGNTERFVFDEEKIQKLRERSTDRMPHCQECEAQYHCGGYCLGEVVNETGFLTGQKPSVCKGICALHRALKNEPMMYGYLHP